MLIWSPGTTLADVERQVIITAYSHYQKVKTTTAVALGISVRTLDTKLQEYAAEEQHRLARLEASVKERRDQRERHLSGTLARSSDDLDKLENHDTDNERRRQQHARERAERRAATAAAGEGGVAADAEDKPPVVPPRAGNGVEPAQGQNSAQQRLSMPQQQKVQDVLPPQSAASGSRNRR